MVTFLNDLLTRRYMFVDAHRRPLVRSIINLCDIKMHVDALAATNRSCTIRSRRNKNTCTLAATKNVAVTSRWIFSFTFCGGESVRARRWNNIWPFAAVDFHQVIQLCCAVRVCLRSSRYTWCTRVAQRPSCIIQIALSLSVCAVITSADVFVTGTPRLVHGRSNGLIALSTQLRNCLQFTISRPDSRTLLADQFYERSRARPLVFFF